MAKGKWLEKIQRLFDINVREVSLVDRPAINESFTEVKRKDDNGNKQEEKVMDEKQVKEAIQSALAPLADSVKAIEERLEAQGKSGEELTKKVDELVTKSEEGTKAHADEVKGIKETVDQVVEDSIKRFERIEGLVTKASSQKINGQEDGEGDDKKSKPKWPSLTGKL